MNLRHHTQKIWVQTNRVLDRATSPSHAHARGVLWWKHKRDDRARTRWLMALIASLALAGLAGCGSGFYVAAPPGFVQLEDQEPDYAFRAASADGVVIALRKIEHRPKADLTFWVKAIQNRLRDRGGYALLSARDVTTKQGLKGKRLTFGHDQNGVEMKYEVTIFVTDDYLYLLEFGGTAQQLARQAARLDWVIENFQLT